MQDPYEEVGTKKMAEEMPNRKTGKTGGADESNTFHIAGNPWFVPKPHLTRKRVTLCGTCF